MKIKDLPGLPDIDLVQLWRNRRGQLFSSAMEIAAYNFQEANEKSQFYAAYDWNDFFGTWAWHHYAYASPDLVALVKPINRTEHPQQIWSPIDRARLEPDTWLFHTAVGPAHLLLKLLPYRLKYVMWHRSSKQKTLLLTLDRFERIITTHGFSLDT